MARFGSYTMCVYLFLPNYKRLWPATLDALWGASWLRDTNLDMFLFIFLTWSLSFCPFVGSGKYCFGQPDKHKYKQESSKIDDIWWICILNRNFDIQHSHIAIIMLVEQQHSASTALHGCIFNDLACVCLMFIRPSVDGDHSPLSASVYQMLSCRVYTPRPAFDR